MASITDEVLLPLKDRLAEWQDVDVAGYYLGKALGVFTPEMPFGATKGSFYTMEPVGEMLIDLLRFLVHQEVLEERDEYGEYRWAWHLQAALRAAPPERHDPGSSPR